MHMHHIPTIIALLIIKQCVALDEPPIIEPNDGDRIHLTVDHPNNLSKTSVSVTGRYHCQSETSFDCSSAGPTFLSHPGTKVHMIPHNIFGGEPSDESLSNSYMDISVWNMYSHGFHVHPDKDDVTVHFEPENTHAITYTIPVDQYPGLHHILCLNHQLYILPQKTDTT
eukprot:228873_1